MCGGGVRVAAGMLQAAPPAGDRPIEPSAASVQAAVATAMREERLRTAQASAEAYEAQRRLECMVCLDKERQMACMSCGHVVLCTGCAQALTSPEATR